MTIDELVSRLNTISALAAGLLGVSVTLVALVPTLVQLARLKAPDFMSQLEREGSLRHVMTALAISVIMFSISLAFTLLGLFDVRDIWLWLALGALVTGLLVLVGMSIRVALIARDVM